MTKKHGDFNGQTLSGYGICFYADYVFNFSTGFFAYNAIIFFAENQAIKYKVIKQRMKQIK